MEIRIQGVDSCHRTESIELSILNRRNKSENGCICTFKEYCWHNIFYVNRCKAESVCTKKNFNW